MKKQFLQFNNISFTYDSSQNEIVSDLNLYLSRGWTGIAGPNGSGKSTLMMLAAGILKPTAGSITGSGKAFYCEQRTDSSPQFFEDFLEACNREACIIKDILKIEYDWLYRWNTLSHGERKRAQIATLLWLEPEILAIDEPTNHLDNEAKKMIIEAVRGYKGIGLLVSHERELMDSLCSQTLFLYPPDAVLRPCGISLGMQIEKDEQKALKKVRSEKIKNLKRLKKESSARRTLADNSDLRVSKKNISSKDHSAKDKINRSKISGRDAVGGKLFDQMQSRIGRAETEIENINCRTQYSTGISLPCARSQRKSLLSMRAGKISLSDIKTLHYPELYIQPGDRIGITGNNGNGKSTLLRKIISELNVPEEKITFIPQEIDLYSSREILEKIKSLEKSRLGELMTITSRLGSRPERLLQSNSPSPGEIRKILLALGMMYEPHIIIMDEPLNHMDLESVTCIENALHETECGLLLVSHDNVFLEKLISINWNIRHENKKEKKYIMDIILN